VVGVDASQSSIQAAQLHARQQGLEIDYYYEDAEAFARSHAGLFDIVTCMEMLEHVPKPANIIAASSQALKAGGVSFFSSINRTLKAFLFAVLIGEYILHLLPKGTHQYHKLICPQELRQWGEGNGLDFVRISSLMYNPLTRRFKLVADKQDVNYLMHFVKKENPDWKASAH
jgi:2-polyprenyl-6-hydroxyphenyl methylase/3-demethylubiquinone-9 3-methyltransferase